MLSDAKRALLLVVIVLGLFYLFTSIFGPVPFSITSVTTTKTDLFTVEGTGEATGIPDTAMVNLGVSKQAATVKEAQDEVNKIANKITIDLTNAGVKVKNIKTTNYSVSPEYDYTNDKQRPKDFIVSQSMEIKLQPIELANKAIDLATVDRANAVGSVSFILEDAEQKKLETKARKEAIDNAKEKAEETAKLAGIRLGKIVNIIETPLDRPLPMYSAMKTADSNESAPTQLSPGENTVRISVTLSYQTL